MNPSKRFILLVDHGSRSAEANQVLDRLAELLRGMTDLPVKTAHLQSAEPTISQAVELCAKAGANEVVVVPIFLVPGRHSVMDIPQQMSEAALKYPELRYLITSPLGAHPKMAEIILEKIPKADNQP